MQAPKLTNKWKIAFIALLTASIFFVAGCAYVSAKLDIPNRGIFTPISWQTFDDPTCNGCGNIHQFVLKDNETGYDYIVVEGYRGLAITQRTK